jgi:hypothetical protein
MLAIWWLVRGKHHTLELNVTDNYTVRINRSEGLVEVTGDDKEWVAEIVEKLAPVYTAAPAIASSPHPDENSQPTLNDVLQTATKTKTKTRRGGSTRASRNSALEAKLTNDVKAKLQAWRDARATNWKKQQNQMAIVSTFLLDELDWKQIDEDDIYTVFSIMGWPIPGNPRATLNNARERAGHFGPWSGGKLELSHTGENFGRSIPAPAAVA